MSPGQQRAWLFLSGLFIALAGASGIALAWTR